MHLHLLFFSFWIILFICSYVYFVAKTNLKQILEIKKYMESILLNLHELQESSLFLNEELSSLYSEFVPSIQPKRQVKAKKLSRKPQKKTL